MNIIKGDAPLLHHYVSHDDDQRSSAQCFLTGHAPLTAYWENFSREQQQHLAGCVKPLEPGEIDSESTMDVDAAISAITSALAGVGVTAAMPSVFDTQILQCHGALFHNDLHGWDNALFLNWYLAGPAREFVVPGVGRVTIHPGDVILFDPSRAHGLLRPGMPKFSKSGWTFDADEISLFLSVDLELTPDLDMLFGIERGNSSVFEKRNSVDSDSMKVNKYSGKLELPRPRRIATNTSNT